VRILLIGRNGQVGAQLATTLAHQAEVIAIGRSDVDVAEPAKLRDAIRAAAPDVIVNAAAYTAVDRAESEPDQARAINADAPALMAAESKRIGALLVHYSTDYVFDGSGDQPYGEEDTPNPLNVYGRTKLEGERAIQSSGCRHVILRTSWVYAERGSNFLLTMLRLAAEKPVVRVVHDQIGSPTWAATIAEATATLLKGSGKLESSLYHLACRGYVSWFDFAREIIERTAHRRAASPEMIPITTDEYPTAARRPRNSRLRTDRIGALLDRPLPGWRDALARCLTRLP
jgi:dTDP-4-dehydrorhamnose reductase